MNSASEEKLSTAERLRLCFEQLGPTFVKLGQLLSTRPDLIPEEFCEEFKKLQDQVAPVPYAEIKGTLDKHFEGRLGEIFEYVSETPLAAASIAQVHAARIRGGANVVLKVQRPGLSEVIEEDLAIMYRVARLLHRYIPELNVYNLVNIVDEFFRNLELETNFIIEGNNIRRFAAHFEDDPQVKIPDVYLDLSGEKVLVLEALEGTPLSQLKVIDQTHREKILRAGLRCYLQMVFRDGFFHGDLHAGNIFLLPDQRLGLIDFGVVGRLNRKTQSAIASMLLALANEDYDRLAYEYIELSPYSQYVDVDRFAKDLSDLIAPYFGLTMKNVNMGRILMSSASCAARYKISSPPELILFFKSMVAMEGMGKTFASDFDFLSAALEFASDLVQDRFSPLKMKKDVEGFTRDASVFLINLPRQLRQLVRRVGHPEFAVQIRIRHLDELRRTIHFGSSLIFLGLVIGSLVLGGSIALFFEGGPRLWAIPIITWVNYGVALALSFAAFINYMRQ